MWSPEHSVFKMNNPIIQEAPVHESRVRIDQGIIELFAERLIRRHLLKQHVDSNHPVYITERRLVEEATEALREAIANVRVSGQNVQLVQMTVLVRVRNALRAMIHCHDIDDDLAESTILGRGERLSLS
jgi:hypothetical protein